MRYGRGNIVGDKEGVEWLDMLSGILNVSLGHGSGIVAKALDEVRLSGLINTYDRQADSAHELVQLLGDYRGGYTWKLLNTGAEAVERAIQVAAVHKGRPPVIAVLEDSFHGKSITMAPIRYPSAWGNPMKVITIHPEEQAKVPDFDMLFFEPVNGWDGKVRDENALAELCAERDAVLVADEMITGFGRCGPRFMSKRAHMIVSGKGLAQGLPLTVLGISPSLAPAAFPLGWNTTAGGNNLCATVGVHVLKHLVAHEERILVCVFHAQKRLAGMGFAATGALGFKRMVRSQSEMRPLFEQNRVIVSWHDPYIRVGPSFVTTPEDYDKLAYVLNIAETE